jgi:hypothetical protein
MGFIDTIQNRDMLWPIRVILGRKHTTLCFTLTYYKVFSKENNNRQTESAVTHLAICECQLVRWPGHVQHKRFFWSLKLRMDSGPNDPPIKWAVGIPFPGLKQPACEADYLSQFRKFYLCSKWWIQSVGRKFNPYIWGLQSEAVKQIMGATLTHS